MKKLLFLSIFTLLAVALFAEPYSSNSPSPTDNTSMDVTFKVGDSAADKIIVAFTDTPCTSFDDDLKAMAKKEINMVFDSAGNKAITDKPYYISYIIVTEQNVKLKLTASSKVIDENNPSESFSYYINIDSVEKLKSDESSSNPVFIPIVKSNNYGVFGSKSFTITSKNNVGDNEIYGANYYGWLSVEVITVS